MSLRRVFRWDFPLSPREIRAAALARRLQSQFAMTPRALAKISPTSVLSLSLLVALLWCDRAAAQEYVSPRAAAVVESSGPGSAELPSLALPRFELITGLALVHLSVPVGALVSLALGPPLFACGLDLFGDDAYDPEQAECEEAAARQSERASRLGMATGLVMGALGLGLTFDGAVRVKRTRAERRRVLARPNALSIQPGAQHAVAKLAWRF